MFCINYIPRDVLGNGKMNRLQIAYRLKEKGYMNRNAFNFGKY